MIVRIRRHGEELVLRDVDLLTIETRERKVVGVAGLYGSDGETFIVSAIGSPDFSKSMQALGVPLDYVVENPLQHLKPSGSLPIIVGSS